jgi:transcriptional regulator with XRE-family HTH domain
MTYFTYRAGRLAVVPTDAARRIRIARAWAGLSRDELAARLGVSSATVERMETGQRPVTVDELVAVGAICKVPEAFMLEGWAALEREANSRAREAKFERALGALADEIRALARDREHADNR